MGLLYELPDQEIINRNGILKILKAPTGLHDIVYNESTSKEEYRFLKDKGKIK